MLTLDEALFLIAREVLLPEAQRVDKDICVCRIENIPEAFRDIVEQFVGELSFQMIAGSVLAEGGFDLGITSDMKFLIFTKREFIECMVEQVFETGQQFPPMLPDYLLSKFVEHIGQPG